MSLRKRPVYLNLFKIKFPLSAIFSIAHRISGILLWLFIPVFLYLLQQSLLGPQEFDQLVHSFSTNFLIKQVLTIFVLSFFYHLLAGLKHICMDFGIASKLVETKTSNYLILFLAFLLTYKLIY